MTTWKERVCHCDERNNRKMRDRKGRKAIISDAKKYTPDGIG